MPALPPTDCLYSPFSINPDDLAKLSVLQNGHIVKIARSFPNNKRQKSKHVHKQLPSKFSNLLAESTVEGILEQYKTLNINAHRENGRVALEAYLKLDLLHISAEQLSLPTNPLPTNPQASSASTTALNDYSMLQASQLARNNVIIATNTHKFNEKLARANRNACIFRNRLVRSKKSLKNADDKVKMLKVQLVNLKRQLVRSNITKSKLEKAQSSHAIKIKDLKQQNCELKAQLEQFDIEIDHLKEKLNALDSVEEPLKANTNTIETKIKGKFCENIRKAVYHCARRQVPQQHISDVINKIAQLLFNQEISPLPSFGTINNMVSEMRYLSKVQAVDAILESSFVNIAWDATSIKTKHLNEIHVNTSSGSYFLDVKTLPGGKSEDYAKHIISALECAVNCYCSFKASTDKVQVLDLVKMKLTSTLSDRAPVNHCVHKELTKYVGHELVDLNCNVHPLDSLSVEFRKVAKQIESQHGIVSKLNGSDSVLLKLITNITKLRHKVGLGESAWFRSFLEVRGFDKLIMRYVGNRFHVLFALCANIRFLLGHLQTYFSSVCQKEISKDILAALKSGKIQKELLVGGLFGKCLTGPWMTCLYRNNSMSNIESGRVLNGAYAKLGELISDPKLLWADTFYCFDNAPGGDPVVKHLRSVPPDEFALQLTTQTAICFRKVMHRQLKRYLEGGELCELPAEQVVLASNAPVDNMISESILGLADTFYRRSANASDAHISAKIGYATNATSDWLDNLNVNSLYAAIGPSRNLLLRSKLDAAEIRDQICERLKVRAQEHANSKRRSITLNIKALMQDANTFAEKIACANLDISAEKVDAVLSIVKSPCTLVGTEFVWIWNDNGRDTSYHYRVVNILKVSSHLHKFLGLCFTDGETIDEAVEHEFSLHDFVADFLAGDAFFE